MGAYQTTYSTTQGAFINIDRRLAPPEQGDDNMLLRRADAPVMNLKHTTDRESYM